MSELEDLKKFVKKNTRKRTKKVIKTNHPFTDSELLDAIRRVGNGKPLSEPSYKKDKGEGDPSTTLFWKRFGSFNNAVEMIYGKQIKDNEAFNELYLVKLVSESGIENQKEYEEKRERFPDLFPSSCLVLKLFKNWGNLFKAKEHFDIKNQLMKCLEVKLALGHAPKIEDYRSFGINVNLLLRKFVLLSQINKHVRLLEEGYEIKRGNKLQTFEDDGESIKRETEKVFKPLAEQLRLQQQKKDSQ